MKSLYIAFFFLVSVPLAAQPVDMLKEAGFDVGYRSLAVINMLLKKGAKIEREELSNPKAIYSIRNFHPFGIKSEKSIFEFHDDTLRRMVFFPINDYAAAIIPYIRLHARLNGTNPPIGAGKIKAGSQALYASTVGSDEYGKAQFEFSLYEKNRRRVLILGKGDLDSDEQDKKKE